MSTSRIITTAALVAFLIASAGLFGEACNRAYRQYEALFVPGRELLGLALWVLGAAGVLVVAGGLVVALVRPFWIVAAGFAASSIALLFAMGVSLWAGGLAFVYLALSLVYARSTVTDLDNRITFTVQSLRVGQDTLLLAAAILVGVSIGLGYREDSTQRGFLLPPAYKQSMIEFVLPVMAPLFPGTGTAEGGGVTEVARQGLERFWSEVESRLQPHVQYVPVVLAILFFLLLETVLRLLSRVPTLVLSVVFASLRVLGVTRVLTDTVQVRRLALS